MTDAVVPMHLTDGDNDDFGICGQALLPIGVPEWEQNWTDERSEVTCEACKTRSDELAFEADEERRLFAAGEPRS